MITTLLRNILLSFEKTNSILFTGDFSMTKYSGDFKIKVGLKYLGNNISYKDLYIEFNFFQ